MTPRWALTLVAVALAATACSTTEGSAVPVPGAGAVAPPGDVDTGIAGTADPTDPATGADATDAPETSAPSETPAPTTATSTVPADTADTASSTTTTTTTTTSTTTTSSTTSSTTTTTTEPPLDVYDPACVVRVEAGESLSLIADRFDDETVDPETIRAENELGDDVIDPGQLLDICVGNGLDDVTGEQRAEANTVLAARAVEDQQQKLNELFAGTGIRELLVDGISGPVTRQRICAARLALGLDVSTEDLEPGSEEEAVIMAAEELPTPFTSAVLSERWILIDRTCQIMFVGSGGDTVFVFPTSTGEPGYGTRDQDRSRAFRYDPASHNGGWHNSTTFPVAIDNPLNGNMYKPIYFDGGQAIHGANNVPRDPQSKGCARLRVEDQEMLVGWLGLADLSAPTWSENRIGVTVNVQGEFVPR